MNARSSPPADLDDNPSWPPEMLARARPMSEVLPPEVLAAFRKMREEAEDQDDVEGKRWMTVRVDEDVLAHLVKAGARFDEVVNAALRRALDLDRASPIVEPRRERA